jgi:hypothetical protein
MKGEFKVISADTCYSFTMLSSYLEIYQVPQCWNGTIANVAFFDWAGCIGSPTFYDGGDKKLLDTRFCKSMPNCGGYDSIAFWCNGIGSPK